METLSTINFLMAAVFAACYCYQVVFAVARLLKKRRRFPSENIPQLRNIAVTQDDFVIICNVEQSPRRFGTGKNQCGK